MKKSLICSLIAASFLAPTAMFASDENNQLHPLITAVPSLSVTPDAAAGGMGDVGAATDANVYSQYWNPSKYVFAKSSAGVGLSYTPWMRKIVDDISLMYLSGYYKIGDMQAVSASMKYFSMGDINLTNADGSDAGSCSPYEMSFDVAYSRLLSKNWSAGVALRYIRVDFGNVENLDPGNAVAADVSGSFRMPIDMGRGRDAQVAAGINLSNIGSRISYDGENNYFLPTNLRLGGSFLYPIDEYNSVSASLDLNKLMVPSTPIQSDYLNADNTNNTEAYEQARKDFNDQSIVNGIFKSFTDDSFSDEMKQIAWALGLEYCYNKQFFVRTGYFHESKDYGSRQFWTFGAGFKLNMLQLDASYSLASSTNPLDQTLRFSLAFDIDGLRDLMR